MSDPTEPNTSVDSTGDEFPKEIKSVFIGDGIAIALVVFSLLAVSISPRSDGFGPGFAFPLYVLGIVGHLFICLYGFVLAIIRSKRYLAAKQGRYVFFLLLPSCITIVMLGLVFLSIM